MRNTKVGRPITKEGRVKVGLSLGGRYATTLDEISVRTGIPKSTIVESAIDYFAKRQDIIEARIKDIDENGDKALLDLKSIIKKREARKIEMINQ